MGHGEPPRSRSNADWTETPSGTRQVPMAADGAALPGLKPPKVTPPGGPADSVSRAAAPTTTAALASSVPVFVSCAKSNAPAGR